MKGIVSPECLDIGFVILGYLHGQIPMAYSLVKALHYQALDNLTTSWGLV